MCHHYASDWFDERRAEREREEADPPADEELTGPGFNEPAVEAVTIEEPDLETPRLDESTTSDD